MTPIEFLYYKHPQLKDVPIGEVNQLLSGEAILELMQDYANYVHSITPAHLPVNGHPLSERERLEYHRPAPFI